MSAGNDHATAAADLLAQGYKTNAAELIEAHANARSPELTAALMKHIDAEATAELDLSTFTVPKGHTIRSGSVRGGKVVLVVADENGRSYKTLADQPESSTEDDTNDDGGTPEPEPTPEAETPAEPEPTPEPTPEPKAETPAAPTPEVPEPKAEKPDAKDLMKLSKAELQKKCDAAKVAYTDTETKADLVAKLTKGGE